MRKDRRDKQQTKDMEQLEVERMESINEVSSYSHLTVPTISIKCGNGYGLRVMCHLW